MKEFASITTEKPEEIFAKLGPKLGYDSDDIEMYGAIIDSIRTIGEKKIRPNTIAWDEEGVKLVDGKVVLPASMEAVIQELLVDNQINSLFLPKDLGGMGYMNLAQAGLSETLSAYDISLQVLTFISMSVMEAMTVYHKEYYNPILEKFSKGKYSGYVAFTEAQAGSHLQNVKTTSVLEGDEYVINGSKIFISNGGYAKCGLVLTRNMVDGKQEGHNVFVVEGLDGITTERLEHKSGLKANPTAQLLFEDVRVPKENIIAGVGKGYKKVLERLMGMRLGVSFQGVGAAMRAYELSKQYAEERVQFGKPIGTFPGVANKLKAMERTIPRMRAYGYMGAVALDRFYKGYIPFDVGAPGDASEKMAAQGLPSPVLSGLAHYFISTGKLYTAEISNSILYDAQQIFGGNGFVSEYEVNKIARDVRILGIYEGTSEIHSFIIGKSQDAINLLPKSKQPYLSQQWEDKTMYENILYARFPELAGRI